MKKIDELLKRRFYLDGGLGTTLIKMGCTSEHNELYNVENPEVIKKIQYEYFEAGSDVVCTNTFCCNSKKADLSKYTLRELIVGAVNVAKDAAKNFDGYVFYDCGPTGEMLYPYGRMSFDDAYKVFEEQAEIVATLDGLDGIIIETVTDLQELRAAVLAFKEKTNLPIFCSMSFEESGRTFTGVSVESFGLTAQGLGVSAMGINCGTGADVIRNNIKRLAAVAHIPVFAKPNAGIPRYENGKTVYDTSAEVFAAQMELIARDGIGILGGCCGTDNEYIRETVKHTASLPVKVNKNYIDAACSYSTMVKFENNKTVIIGERVNPTNKPLLKQAIIDDNFDYILTMCVEQAEQGADMLDMNLGMAGIDEAEKLKNAVAFVQGVADLPLVIDTSKKNALEQAVRVTNGICVINSVNGEKEVMERVFPIAAKYGSYVIALCMDNDGIPDNANGRLYIAERIIEAAKAYGIGKEKLIFDPLTMAVSVNKDNAVITLDTLARLKEELGVKTTLGLSNVSFGLPNRAKINSTFLQMAIDKGISSAIVNPVIKAKIDKDALLLLEGKDERCTKYIEANAVKETTETAITERDIKYCILHGLTSEGVSAVKQIATTENYNYIIEKEIIDGLNELGKAYEQGRAFLPQLIAGSETAKAMLEYIKANFMTEKSVHTKATIVLATVKGDVHDIGKNIVKAVVGNYGYRCIDLGRDVPTEAIIDAIEKYKPQVVGLSALMTTTLDNMTETAIEVKKRYPDVKIFVGGAVVTKSYADGIGVYYSKDAQENVKKLEELFNIC